MEGFEYIKSLCHDSNCMWLDYKDVNIQDKNSTRVELSESFEEYAFQPFRNHNQMSQINRLKTSANHKMLQNLKGGIQKPKSLKISNESSNINSCTKKLLKSKNKKEQIKTLIQEQQKRQVKPYEYVEFQHLKQSNNPSHLPQTIRCHKSIMKNNKSLELQAKPRISHCQQRKNVCQEQFCVKLQKTKNVFFTYCSPTPSFKNSVQKDYIKSDQKVEDLRVQKRLTFSIPKNNKNATTIQGTDLSYLTSAVSKKNMNLLENAQLKENVQIYTNKEQRKVNLSNIITKTCQSQITSNLKIFSRQNTERSQSNVQQSLFSLNENSFVNQRNANEGFCKKQRTIQINCERVEMPCIPSTLERQPFILPESPVEKLSFLKQNDTNTNTDHDELNKPPKSSAITLKGHDGYHKAEQNIFKPFFKSKRRLKSNQNQENEQLKHNQYFKEQGIQYFGINTVISNFSHMKQDSELCESYAIFRLRDCCENGGFITLLSPKLAGNQRQNNSSIRQKQSSQCIRIDQVPSCIQRQEIDLHQLNKNYSQPSAIFFNGGKNQVKFIDYSQKQKAFNRKKTHKQLNSKKQVYDKQNYQQKSLNKVNKQFNKGFIITPIDTNLMAVNPFFDNLAVKTKSQSKAIKIQQKAIQQKNSRIRKTDAQEIEQCQFQHVEPQKIGSINIIKKSLISAPIKIKSIGLIFCLQKVSNISKDLAQQILSIESPFLIRNFYIGGENLPENRQKSQQEHKYFISEFLGYNLEQQILMKGGKLDELTCKNYLQNILKGLEYLEIIGFPNIIFSKKDVFIPLSGTIAKLNPISILTGDRADYQLVNTDNSITQSQKRSEKGKKYLAALLYEMIYGYVPNRNDMAAALSLEIQEQSDLHFINKKISARLSNECKKFLKELILISFGQSQKSFNQLINEKWFQLTA